MVKVKEIQMLFYAERATFKHLFDIDYLILYLVTRQNHSPTPSARQLRMFFITNRLDERKGESSSVLSSLFPHLIF